MKNQTKRILLFLIAIPSLSALFFWGNIYYFLPLNILVLILSGLSSYEMTKMFKAIDVKVNTLFMTIIGVFLPLVTWLDLIGLFKGNALLFFIMAVVILIFIITIFKSNNNGFKDTLPAMAASLMIIIYPGLFITHIVKMTFLPNSSIILFIFTCIVYLNDSNAWLFGVLFGKKSRGFIAVSPNKSIVGFLGGIFASIIVAVSSKFLFPEVITGSIPLLILLGFVAGVTTILGDLVESGMKRSSGIKDSGRVIPGRGGMLDSIDSLIFAAPGFYYVILLATAGL
ncbi:MAG: phosphatidate cytidylyltransferase [Deltaproteobacteria bacterium]|nr:phosphatidate cytidylyltransferase [Deltaproteobacteria bacterium]